MLNARDIKKVIKDKIDQGIKSFAIYPFGENGVKVKNILADYFNITPLFIVDNEYSKYNENILSFDRFLKENIKDCYILLTVENFKLNGVLKNQMIENGISEEKIINLLVPSRPLSDRLENQFALKNILPYNLYDKVETCGKIKVRIAYQTSTSWNAIRTIVQAFNEDEKYDLKIIGTEYVESIEKALVEKQCEAENIAYVWSSEYIPEEDMPDIFIVSHLFGQVDYKIAEYSKLVIYASMSLILYGKTAEVYWSHLDRYIEKCNPDYYLCDTLLFNELNKFGYKADKLVELGNAKFDGIYSALQRRELPKDWKKLENKKIITWLTDHGVHEEYIEQEVTFDKFAKTVFRYAQENSDVGIIFRPHRSFLRELVKYNLWSKKDFEIFRKYCDSTSNVIFDETDSYDEAISCADAIIMDAYSGTICSVLPTLKPICVTYRFKEEKVYYEELLSCYYSAYENKDIVEFIENMRNGKDDMYELRKQAAAKFVKNFDGNNGRRIKEFIEQKYFEKCKG